jgi:hypothetical protein
MTFFLVELRATIRAYENYLALVPSDFISVIPVSSS